VKIVLDLLILQGLKGQNIVATPPYYLRKCFAVTEFVLLTQSLS